MTTPAPHDLSLPPYDLLVLLGATASGKTRLAVQLADALDGEIVSADSRQVFRGMDLGSGKDLAEYGSIPYHLIDLVEPTEPFSLFDYVQRARPVIADIRRRGRWPILCGGSGLYLSAIVQGYQLTEAPPDTELRRHLDTLDLAQLRQHLRSLRPQLHNQTDLTERARLIRAIEIATAEQQAETLPVEPPHALVFGLRWPRPLLRQRIAQRLHQRLADGLIDEVARLQRQGVSWQTLEFFGLEYRFVAQHLQGQLDFAELCQQLSQAIGQFAKRQDTWFRRMERQGLVIHWLDGQADPFAQLHQKLRALDLVTTDHRP